MRVCLCACVGVCVCAVCWRYRVGQESEPMANPHGRGHVEHDAGILQRVFADVGAASDAVEWLGVDVKLYCKYRYINFCTLLTLTNDKNS